MRILTGEEAASFRLFVEGHDFFFVAGHREPDGDCVSSCLALGMLLDECGKGFQLLSAGPFKRTEIASYEARFSPAMRFLSEEERKRSALIIVDCSDLPRLGNIEGDFKGLDTFIIDHHKSSDGMSGTNAIVDPTAPAACCLVQMLYEKMLGSLKRDAAEVLFLGLATDTGYFRFLGTDSSNVFGAAGRLVDAGVSPRRVYDEMTGGKPWTTRKLLALLLTRAKQYLDGKLVVTYETMEDTFKWGMNGRDNDALYQALLSTEGVEAVVFLRQETESTCTGGFRSRGEVDVSLIAAKFGGGGHKNASGMSVESTIDTLLIAVVKEFAKVLM